MFSDGGITGETGSEGVADFFHLLEGVEEASSSGRGGNMPPGGVTGGVVGVAGSGSGVTGAGGLTMTGGGVSTTVSFILSPVMRSCRG